MALANVCVRRVAHHLLSLPGTCCVRWIQVAVPLLSASDQVCEFVKLCFQLRIASQLKQVGGSLHDLVEIRIDEPLRPMAFDFLSSQKVSGGLQMFDTGLRAFKSEWHKRRMLSHQSRTPEVAGHLDFIERHGAKRIIGSRRASKQGESHQRHELSGV